MNKAHEPIYEIIQEPEADNHSELGRLWGILLDEKRLIAIVVSLFVLGGIFNALFTTPVFKADALLQVEQKSAGMSGLADLTGAFEMESEATTEIEVLMSRMVISKVVDELHLDIVAEPRYLPVVGRGLARIFGGDGILAGLFSSYAWGGEYIRVARLDVPDELLGETLLLKTGEQGAYQLSLDDNVLVSGKVGEIADGKGIRILVSDLVDRAGLEFHVGRVTKISAIRDLQDALSVSEKGRRTGVLSVSLQGTDKAKTRKILDSVARQYLLQNVQRLSAEAEKSLQFLEEKLPEVNDRLMKAEGLLNSFRLKNESVDLSLETQSILEQVVKLEGQLNELELEETKLKKLFTKEHPYYVSLQEKRETLNSKKADLQSKIKGLPETQQEILRLTRDLEVNQTLYIQMLNKVQELSIVKAGTVGNVRILDTAELLQAPVKPKKTRIVIVSLILGLLLGIVIAYMRVAMRRGIESPDQLEHIGLPVYATIPLSEVQQKLSREQKRKTTNGGPREPLILAKIAPDDVAIESIRSLRTSMHFAMLETHNNILMITGPGQELGKSFVSANLGAVYAISNQKVLIIDADMRKGHLHRAFGTEREKGLSELLSAQIEKEVAIRKTEIAGLDFVPCGTNPPNPSELLMHKNLQDFLQWASKQYDLVIVDTPPILAVTDATVVGRYAGVTMFVVRFEQTQRKEVELAYRRCEQSGINVKGSILNGIVQRKSSYYGYGYDGYRYAQYKYSEDKQK
ncbi:MAG TPA: polysaccharide biosynthesis tyrosine autokinase [Gammaproteobacteria bacterium]